MAAQQQQQNSAERRADTRRQIGLLDRSIAGPVASLWASSLHRTSSSRLSDSGAGQLGAGSSLGGGGASSQRTRFLTTKTEDAMDGGCIIPCVLEEWFRPVLQQNSKFGNPAKLQFRYSAH